MKEFTITIDDGSASKRKIKVEAEDKNEAMLKFLWWQLDGVSIKEKKPKKKKSMLRRKPRLV